jgi:hypothetical protein
VCPRCGVATRSTPAPWLGAIAALGLSLASCSGADDADTAGGPSSTTADATMSGTSNGGGGTLGNSATSNASATGTGDATADSATPTTAQPPYGVPDTDDGFPGDDTMGTTGTSGTGDDGDTGEKLDLPDDAG